MKAGSSHCGSVETNPLACMRTQVQSLASLRGLRIRHCCELWCRSQMRLGLDPCLGTSICLGCGPKKIRQREKRQRQVWCLQSAGCYAEGEVAELRMGGFHKSEATFKKWGTKKHVRTAPLRQVGKTCKTQAQNRCLWKHL